MQIGIVTGEFPPLAGGVGDYSREIARGLVRRGHGVHVLTDARCPPVPQDGFMVHALARGWGWGTLWRLRRRARALGLEVLLIQYQAAAYGMRLPIHFLPRWAGLASVVTFHDLRVPYLFPKAGRLRWAALRMMARDADGVIVSDPADEQRLQSEVRPGHLAQVPIGSNIPNVLPRGYDRTEWRNALGVQSGESVIGTFGFFNASKGGEVLLKAVGQLAEQGARIKVLLIGGARGASDPTDRATEERMLRAIAAHHLQANVIRTGYVSPETVSGHLTVCDVVALPYLDGVSLRRGSLMAALAHGCAIVSTGPDLPQADIRDGTHALLVTPGAADELANALWRLVSDPPLRQRLGQGALELADKFSWDKIVPQVEAVLLRARSECGRP